MRYLAIALIFLSLTVNAQSEKDSMMLMDAAPSSKTFLAWRVGGPDIEKPKKKASKISEKEYSTLSIRSVKEDLKGIGVYTFTSEESSTLSIQFNSYANQSMLIQLLDKTGKVLHSQFLTVEGDDEDYSLDISSFKDISYHLILSNVKQKRMSMFVIERDKKI